MTKHPTSPAPHAHGGYRVSARIDGTRKTFYGGTHAEACAKRDEALRLAGMGITGGDVPLAEWLTLWLGWKQSGTHGVRPVAWHTYRRYRALITTHLIPALGTVKIDRLSRGDVQRFIDAMRAKGARAATINDARDVLVVALNDAMYEDRIPRNAAAMTRRVQEEARAEPHALTQEEARRFLASIEGDRLEALWHVVFALGVRQGEALGLSWASVDLAKGHIQIREQLQRENGQWVIKELKGNRRGRTVVLPPSTLGVLRRHHGRQNEERATAAVYHDRALVFCHPDGRPYHSTMIRTYFHAAIERARVPLTKMHHTRHTAVTLLLAQGLSMYEVSRTIGHSSQRVTDTVYAHLADEDRSRAAAAMERALYTEKQPEP